MTGSRFSFQHLLIKLTCRKFVIWAVSTVLCFICVISRVADGHTGVIVICWAVLSGLYFIGDILIDAIAKAVGNISTSINLGGRK